MSSRGRWSRPRVLLVAFVTMGIAGALTLHWWPRAQTLLAAEARDVPREEGGAILISEAFSHRAGISLAEARQEPLAPIVKVVGTVSLDPRRVSAVGTRTPGFVRRVFALEGDQVRVGEALAEIESAELGAAQAKVSSAIAEEKAASTNARREAALLENHLTTAREAEEAAAKLASREANLAAARQGVEALGGEPLGKLGLRVLRSPIAGHVVERRISVGQSVEPHKLAFRIANLDSVWVELEVFERTVGLVRIGDSVELTPMAEAGRHIKGKVAHVGELIDSASRSTDVRVEVENKQHLLRPGQSITALIHLSGPTRNTLSVPAEAVTFVDDTPLVFVAATPTRFVPTKVRVGVTDGSRQEIIAGLTAGTKVVEKGIFAIKSELFR